MEKGIKWEREYEMALNLAKESNKPLFLFYMSPSCVVCQELNKKTFQDPVVIEFINNYVIPLRVAANDLGELSIKLVLKRVPTLLVMDFSGTEHHRMLGFYSPIDLIPAILVGISKLYFDSGELKKALSSLDELFNDYPDSTFIPEGIQIRGACLFRKTRQHKYLREVYEQLKEEYPLSEWTKRFSPYRLLKE